MQGSTPRQLTPLDLTVLAAAALTALGLGVIGARSPLSLAEIDTLVAARESLASAATYATPAHHPLYALLARWTTRILGEGALALRLPALLLGAGSVGLLGLLAHQVTSRRNARLAALLFALSYPSIAASTTARGDSAAIFVSLLASGLLLRVQREADDRVQRGADDRVQRGADDDAVFGLAACCVLLLLCHWSFVVFLASLVLAGVVTSPRRARSIVACGAIAGLACTPVLLGASTTLDAGEGISTALWQVLASDSLLHRLEGLLSDLAQGRPAAWLAAALLVPCGLGMQRVARAGSRALPALVLLHLALSATLASFFPIDTSLVLPAAPLVCLFLVEGLFAAATLADRLLKRLVRRSPGARRLGLAASVALLIASWVTAVRAWEVAQDFPGAAAYVAQRRSPDAARVALGPAAFALRERTGEPWRPVDDAAALREIEARHDEVWVLQGFRRVMRQRHPDLLVRLEQEFEPQRTFSGRRGDLVVHRSKFADVEIVAQDLGDGFHVLSSRRGCNTLVLADADGTLLVDPSHWGLQRKLRRALDGLGAGPPRWVVNSHWHFDHSGGNEPLARRGAVVAATSNARDRMRTAFERKQIASPRSLPTRRVDEPLRITFAGQTVHAFPVPPAHTDGDLIVHFPEAGIVHMGDLFVNGGFPYISAGSGGSVDGVIAAQRLVSTLADETTRIVPGHGPVGSLSDLRAAMQMLEDARSRIAGLRAAGLDLDRVLEADPLRDLEDAWGGGWIGSRDMAKFIYTTLGEARPEAR